MRKKVSISIQNEELKIIDERSEELELTRSSYLMALVLRDTMKKKDEKKRITDFSDKKKEPKPLD